MKEDCTFRSNAAPRARVIAYLRRALEAGEIGPGDQILPELELCERLGVSRTTVRAALNDLARENFFVQTGRRRIIRRRRTAPLRSLMTDTIAIFDALIYPEEEARCWGDWLVFYHLSREAERRKCHTLRFVPGDFSREKARQLIDEQPFGLVLLHISGLTPGLANLLNENGKSRVPVVGYDSAVEGIDTVASDHRRGCYQLTRWMLENGRRSILRFWHLNGGRAAPRPEWLKQRDLGYEDAMREAGLEPQPAVEYYEEDRDPSDRQDFDRKVFQTMGRLYEHFRPDHRLDAILCASDGVCSGVAAACRRMGLEPNRDVWLAGYDNNYVNSPDRLFENCAPMVTMDKGDNLIGQQLIEMLSLRRDGLLPEACQQFMLPPTMVFPGRD